MCSIRFHIEYNKLEVMTQVSISSLMMLNLYLLLANFKRPESEKKKKKKYSRPSHFYMVTQYHNIIKCYYVFSHINIKKDPLRLLAPPCDHKPSLIATSSTTG